MKKICFFILGMLALMPFLPSVAPSVALAQTADCTTVGQRVAAEQAGQLTKATAAVQNGRNVCIVVVLVPGKEKEKPRRVEIAVPAN